MKWQDRAYVGSNKTFLPEKARGKGEVAIVFSDNERIIFLNDRRVRELVCVAPKHRVKPPTMAAFYTFADFLLRIAIPVVSRETFFHFFFL